MLGIDFDDSDGVAVLGTFPNTSQLSCVRQLISPMIEKSNYHLLP